MYPICLHCGAHLEVEEELELDYDYAETVKREVYGRCPDCGKTYYWTQVFVFSENIDLERTDEDEDDE